MTRKTDPAAKPARKTSARRSRAATTPAAPAVAPSTLRRDLGRQASRFALLTAMTLAAGATFAPGEARADCVVVGVGVQCAPTTTTNTASPTNTPNDRHYQGNSFLPMALTVAPGATVDGAGLSITNTNGGGVTVINDGAIRVNPGVQPTEGGDAALSIRAGGGSLEYLGAGSISNAGVGDGLHAENSGSGLINMNVGGPVTSSTGTGIYVTDSLTGTGILLNTGAVTADNGAGILVAAGTMTGDVNITTNGAVRGATAGVSGAMGGLSAGDLNITTNAAVQGAIGIDAINFGTGAVIIEANGPVTGTAAEGIRAIGNDAVDITFGGPVTGATGGITVIGGSGGTGDLRVRGTGAITAANGAGVDIFNDGAGVVGVQVGDITATNGDGVRVRDRTFSGGVNVSAGNISANGGYGVDVVSSTLTGGVVVDVTGDIQSGQTGVRANLDSPTATGDIDVIARGDITGAAGIAALNGGTGNIRVQADGDIRTTTFDGITATGRGGVDVQLYGSVDSANHGVNIRGGGSGAINLAGGGDVTARNGAGAIVLNAGSGAVTVDLGDIKSTNTGLRIRDTIDGGDIDVQTGSVRSSAGTAVSIETDSLTAEIDIDIDGDLSGGGGFAGALVNVLDTGATGDIDLTVSGSVDGGFGLSIDNRGTGDVSVNVAGPVSGRTAFGALIRGRAGVNVDLADTVTGATNGIHVEGGGGAAGDIALTGGANVVAQNGYGIRIENNGTGAVTVDVGDIDATNGNGLSIQDSTVGGDISVRTGSVIARGARAIDVITSSASADIDIAVDGDLRAEGGYGAVQAAIDNAGSIGDIRLSATGSINGAKGAVAFNTGVGDISMDFDGAVTGRVDAAVYAEGLGGIAVDIAGPVTGGTDGINLSAGGAGAHDVSVTGGADIVALGGNGVIIDNGGSGAVTVDVGDIEAAGGDGVHIADTAAGGDINITTGAVTALDGVGLNVVSESDTADLSIVANGDIRGGTAGVQAGHFFNADATGDVNVTVNGDVSGETGAEVVTIGSGDVSFTAAGTVTSSLYNAVNVGTAGSGAVNVRVGGVDGAQVGISAGSNGGDVTIVATGAVTARNGQGVDVFAVGGAILIDVAGPVSATNGSGVRASGDGAISITTGAVTAGEYGIEADSDSETDDIVIIANGDVLAGDGYYGINARMDDQDAEGDIDITTRGAVEGDVGIYAQHDGLGDIRVRADGDVTGRVDEGIFADAGGSASVEVGGRVTADSDAILVNAGASGTGDLSVTGTGSVISRTGHGVSTFNEGSGTTTIDLSGDIRSDADFGVVAVDTALGGDIRITTGNVSGRDGAIVADSISLQADIDITANGDLTSPDTGVFARLNDAASTGDIRIHTRGAIRGGTGIFARNNGAGDIAVTADGDIDGGGGAAQGIYASGQANVSVVLAGDISNTLRGVTMVGGGGGTGDVSLTGSGNVSGADAGVEVLNQGSGATIVDLTGAVSATAGYGVVVSGSSADGGDISVTTGSVTSRDTAVQVSSVSERANIDIVANGDVRSEQFGVRAELDNAAHGDIGVTTRGVVDGGYTGIHVSNRGAGDISIRADGPVTGRTASGISAFGNGAADLVINGAVSGAANGVTLEVGPDGGDISITGTGSVTSGDGYGVVVLNSGVGAINYDLSGPVSASGDGGAIGVLIASSNADAGDITVTSGSVRAEYDTGVFAISSSRTGNVSVTTNGDVIGGTGGIGAVLLDAAATGDITLTANGAVRGGLGIAAQNIGLGAIRIATNGAVTGTEEEGVYATGNGDIAVAVAGSVTGATRGVWLEHMGIAGDLSVTGAGAITGQAGNAVSIMNSGLGTVTVDLTGPLTAANNGVGIGDTATGGDINVAVGSITATGVDSSGVYVLSNALGANVSVLTRGAINAGADGTGVIAILDNAGAAGDVRVDTRSTVTAGTGIVAQNRGSGAVNVATVGAVTGTTDIGIYAAGNGDIGVAVGGPVTGATTGLWMGGLGIAGDLSLTGAGAITSQNGDAVTVVNRGLGTTTVNLTGALNATGGSGLRVRDTTAGGALDIAVGSITAAGTANGVDVVSLATGANMSVLARGPILLSGNGTGILAGFDSAAATGNVNVNSLGAITAARGIQAFNDGAGSVAVTASGPVIAGEHGVTAFSNGGDVSVQTSTVVSALTGFTGVWAENLNAASAGNVTVQATDVVGWRGVMARNLGDGETRVTTTGSVQSTDIGVLAFAGAGSSDVTVDVRDVSGGLVGAYIDNNGVGNTDLTIRGAVSGSDAAVAIRTSDTQAVRVANAGTIRNSSGLGSDAAIIFEGGGSIDLINTGSITGELSFGGDVNTFDNRGSWTAAGGDNLFAGADDELINTATGSILAMSTAGVQDITRLRGLETFDNRGRLSMNDNGAGDAILTTANTLFAAGSVLQLDIAGQNIADLFATTGTLAIEAGARLEVNFVLPLSMTGRYVIARADGGLTGTFDFEDRLLSAFIGLRDGYTATTAYIEIGQLRALRDAGLTPNQRETAAGADSLPNGNALRNALLLLPDDATAQDAFDQLSGEIHPAARRAMVDDSRLSRDAVLDRLVEDRAHGSVWGQALVSERNTDEDGNAAEVENDSRGLVFGVDQRVLNDTVTVGLAGGWFSTDLDILRRNSTGATQSTQALAYLGARMDRWGLRTGVGYAKTSTETQREIGFPGFTASPSADYDGSVLQVFVETGYRLPLGGGYVEPFAGMTMVAAETDAFTETGGAQAAISGESKSDDVLITTLGFRFETDQQSAFALRGMTGYRNTSGDLEPIGRHRFEGGDAFTVMGAEHSDIAAIANLEALWRLSPNVTVGAAYDGVFGNKGEDHAVTGRFRIAF